MLALFENLLNIKSPTGSEEDLGEYLFGVLQQYGFQVKKQYVDEKRFNVFATTEQRPRILFSTHMDTVLPDVPLEYEGTLIKGRGACDAKGSMFSMLMAAELLLQENITEFGMLFVVGEEMDSDGAKKAAELKLDSEYVIIGEPTQNKLAIGQKGTIVFRITADGKAGHSAYPEQGVSAIHSLVPYLSRLLILDLGEDDYFGKSTINIGQISGGTGPNVISGHAEAEGIIRVAGSLQHIKEKIEVCDVRGVHFEILSECEALKLVDLAGFDSTIVSFGSDASYLKPLGQVLMIGPGSVEFAHSKNEQITFNELAEATELYVKIAKNLLN